MKKVLSAVLAAAMMITLSSCDAKEAEQTETTSAEVTAETVSETASALTEESKTKTSETEADMAVNNKITPPDEEFLRNNFDIGKDHAVFTMDVNGKYAVSDHNSLFDNIAQVSLYYMYQALNKENFEENKDEISKAFGNVSTYDELIDMLESSSDEVMHEIVRLLENEPEKAEPLAYFSIDMYDDSEDMGTQFFSDEDIEDIFIKITEYLFERINENPEIAGMINDCLGSGDCFYATAVARYEGENVIKIESCFSEILWDYLDEESEFYLQESMTLDEIGIAD